MNPQSCAKFEKQAVLEAAERMVRHIDGVRVEKKRKMIAREISRRRRWNARWWWPFKFSVETADVEESLKGDLDTRFAMLAHYEQRDACCEVITLCQRGPDESDPFVWLCNEHVRLIYGPKT